jgi:hypothetical protein
MMTRQQMRGGGAWPLLIFLVIGMLVALAGCDAGATTAKTSTPTARASTGGTGGAIGGAQITKQFVRSVTGGQCFSGTGTNKGKAAFGFPTRDASTAALSFSLGPLTDGLSPGQEHNKPYAGAGSYDNIGIVVRPESGSPVIGYGTVTVNSNLHSGSFQMTNPSASGTWDCGVSVNP